MRKQSANAYPQSKTCTAVIGSMTVAIKAHQALMSAGIYSTVIKVSSTDTDSGCAYGLSFNCSQSSVVRSVLNASNIRIRKLLS